MQARTPTPCAANAHAQKVFPASTPATICQSACCVAFEQSDPPRKPVLAELDQTQLWTPPAAVDNCSSRACTCWCRPPWTWFLCQASLLGAGSTHSDMISLEQSCHCQCCRHVSLSCCAVAPLLVQLGVQDMMQQCSCMSHAQLPKYVGFLLFCCWPALWPHLDLSLLTERPQRQANLHMQPIHLEILSDRYSLHMLHSYLQAGWRLHRLQL